MGPSSKCGPLGEKKGTLCPWTSTLQRTPRGRVGELGFSTQAGAFLGLRKNTKAWDFNLTFDYV